uniref:Uncharacterized protein n=1 Tax=Arundo donax TaxID=35708 RepID=A0A0A9AZE9_ARUDO
MHIYPVSCRPICLNINVDALVFLLHTSAFHRLSVDALVFSTLFVTGS